MHDRGGVWWGEGEEEGEIERGCPGSEGQRLRGDGREEKEGGMGFIPLTRGLSVAGFTRGEGRGEWG